MNTQKFIEIFLEYARTGVRPTQYISAINHFIREYHHISEKEFLQYRKEFIEECQSDNSINHCHCYLPANFENNFLNLCYHIQKADSEVKFENVIIEGLFILNKFVNDYAEMLFDRKKTVASIKKTNADRDRSICAAATQHYTDFSKTVEENLFYIKKKYLSHYGSEYDDFIRDNIRDLFIFKKLSLIDELSKKDLIEKGVAQLMKIKHSELTFGK